MLQKVGIECKYITGRKDLDPHAWNQVKIDGNWYNCDLTFDINNIKDNMPLNYCLNGKSNSNFTSRTLDKEFYDSDLSELNYDQDRINVASKKVKSYLQDIDYKLTFPRLKEIEERAYLYTKGASKDDVIRYIIAKNSAQTEEEKNAIWEKYYALKLKNRHEARSHAIKQEQFGDIDIVIEYLIHCRERGLAVYVDFNGCRLYSCDFDLNTRTSAIKATGLSKIEIDDLFKEYTLAQTEEEKKAIYKKSHDLIERNKEKIRKQEEYENELLKKYYPKVLDNEIKENSKTVSNEIDDLEIGD